MKRILDRNVKTDKSKDKTLETSDKVENKSGDSESRNDKVDLDEINRDEYRSYTPRKRVQQKTEPNRHRQGILKLCKRCNATFVSYEGESICQECRRYGNDESTKTFGSVLDGCGNPF